MSLTGLPYDKHCKEQPSFRRIISTIIWITKSDQYRNQLILCSLWSFTWKEWLCPIVFESNVLFPMISVNTLTIVFNWRISILSKIFLLAIKFWFSSKVGFIDLENSDFFFLFHAKSRMCRAVDVYCLSNIIIFSIHTSIGNCKLCK